MRGDERGWEGVRAPASTPIPNPITLILTLTLGTFVGRHEGPRVGKQRQGFARAL